MAINDIYMADFVQRWGGGGEEMHNNFFYRAMDADGTAQALYGALTDTDGVIDAVNSIQSDHVKNDRLRVLNLFSLTDFYEDVVTGDGEQTAAVALPAQNTLAFTYKLNTRGVKPGRKSISGVPQSFQNAGRITDSGAITLINGIRLSFGGHIIDSDTGAEFEPVVVKRVKTLVEATETRPEHYKYDLPTEIGDLNYGSVTAVLAKLKLGSMDTRDNGR